MSRERTVIPFTFESSQKSSGSNDTGTANFLLRTPLRFENSRPKLGFERFTFTNSFININPTLGNTLHYSDDIADPDKYTITFETGAWSLSSINKYIIQQLVFQNHAPALFQIFGDDATQKIYILFYSLIGWYVHMPATGSIANILGLTANTNYPANQSNIANEVVLGDTTASIDSVTTINVASNLSNSNVYNQTRSGIMYTTSPIKAQGSRQQDVINDIVFVDGLSLSQGISEIKISITDQDGNPISMLFDWIIKFYISY